MMRRFLVVLCCVCLLSGAFASAATTVKKQPFGKTSAGTAVDVYTLTNGDIEVRILTLGGIIQSLKTPDRKGNVVDITLGCPDVAGYEIKANPYFGAIVGRYANRIAGGKFQIAGTTYSVPKNNGDNALHGGPVGFNSAVWKAAEIKDGVELTHVSPDGDQGFPGKLTATVRYTLSDKTLKIEYAATTDKPTVVNLTNHAYFNLKGQGAGDILDHELTINASKYSAVNANLIPLGDPVTVEGTPFDFRKPHRIGERIDAAHEQIKLGGGYDHNYVLETSGKLVKAAEAYEPGSGRTLEVYTTEPGVQLYTGNFLDGTITGKEGKVYGRRSGFCLETQHYPDSPNHPTFPSTELKPGEKFHSVTEFRFGVR